jgi:predicted nucleic acid-binding protein
MLRYMLDTNICIYVIKNRPPRLRQRFNALADQLCISVITLAELIYAEKSARPQQNLAMTIAVGLRWSYWCRPTSWCYGAASAGY